MSNKLVNDMRAIRLPPVAKAVLWVLCDIADDNGSTFNYAPLSRLTDETCYQRDAVIGALAWIESVNLILADRTNGRKTTYKITLQNANKQAIDDELNRKKAASKRQLPPKQPVDQNAEPVGENDQSAETTSRPERKQPVDQNAEPVGENVPPVDQTDTNRIIPIIRKEQPIKQRDAQILKPDQVSDQVWSDFIKHRKTLKKNLTQTALNGIIREADKANWTLEAALSKCLERGWVGFEAEWVTKKTNSPESQSEKWAHLSDNPMRTVNESSGVLIHAN